MTEMGRARSKTDVIMVRKATNLPHGVTGTLSPYPTVINVTMHHQKLAGILLYGLFTYEQPLMSDPSL